MAMFYVEAMANSHASNMVLPWFYHEPFSYGFDWYFPSVKVSGLSLDLGPDPLTD